MLAPLLLVILAGFTGVSSLGKDKLCFPPNFAFGVATAAYQIEGAWNVSGKGENIWDRYTHTHPDRVFDHQNGDVTDDSYHLFKEDVKLLSRLGVGFYRFSISWSRILPDGLSNNVNEDGIRYYRALIQELFDHRVAPLVTMYHWDLPQPLQDLGGWTNPIMADYFVDYARVLFQYFGDDVTMWLTFNEPLTFCHDGYGGSDAPGGRASGFEDYLCAHNVLRAHGMAYNMYKNEFREKQRGFVGITLDISWVEPNTTSSADAQAAETARQFNFGWFANPIFSETGDYPAVMRQRIDDISKQQGFSRSRLPTFTAEEVELIKGSADYLGVNHYTTYMASQGRRKISPQPSYEDDMGVRAWQKDEWPRSNSTWLRIVPWGFRKALNWIRTTYSNPIIFVTENGVSLEAGLHDPKRVQYISSYLTSLLGAIKDGCKVFGYTYWSLIDNFEWMRGYSERFGLFEVDYKNSSRPRSPRLSAAYYTQVARTRCLPDGWLYYDYQVNK